MARHLLAAIDEREQVDLTRAVWEFSQDGKTWVIIPDSEIEPGQNLTVVAWDTSALDPGNFRIRVTLTNAAGRRRSTEVQVRIDRPAYYKQGIPIGDFCGVQTMDVVTTGDSQVATQGRPGAGGGTMPIALGPHDTVPANLSSANADDRYDLYMAFDVVAVLETGSAPELCEEIQLARGTSRKGGSVTHKRGQLVTIDPWTMHAEQDCPYSGADLCHEGTYDGQIDVDLDDGTRTHLKIHGQDLIAWFDGPGFAVLQRSGMGPQGLSNSNTAIAGFETGVFLQAHFRAYVLGTRGRGSWQCDWEVDFRFTYVPATGNVTKNQSPRVTDENCRAVNLVAH